MAMINVTSLDVPRLAFVLVPGRVRNNGTVRDQVMVKASPDAPEMPMAGARVRLHRAADGACAWQGVSDAQGNYRANGLEVGMKYVPVATDSSGTYECVAAGPVTAVVADA